MEKLQKSREELVKYYSSADFNRKVGEKKVKLAENMNFKAIFPEGKEKNQNLNCRSRS